MKDHFPIHEFINASSGIPKDFVPEGKALESINFWKNSLNPIRDMLKFPISITDWIRIHHGEKSRSQHYCLEEWSINGAIDLRPSNRNNKEQYFLLASILMVSPIITRVCYYRPSDRFPTGGFHCDCKSEVKQLYINHGQEIDWELSPFPGYWLSIVGRDMNTSNE